MHREAIFKNSMFTGKPIIAGLFSEAIMKQQHSARIALKAMFTTLQYLAKQGISIRGHDHGSGNYMELLAVRSHDIPELKDFLLRSKPMTGWMIQNEMLQMMGKALLHSVLKGVREDKEFSIIVDETTDCSTKEQVSITVRSVGKQFDVKEQFLGLYETTSTTSETLTDIIKDPLVRCSLSLDHLRGQCYDGASNMKGVHSGVQARIYAIQPLAVYIHCCNHSLNLALQDTARAVPQLRDALQWVHDAAKILNTSKGRNDFLEIVNDLEDIPMMTLKTLCPTRWTVRHAAINSVLATYPAVTKMMEHLSTTGTDSLSVAAGLFTQFKKCEVYLFLLIAKDVFGPTEKLSLVLEGQTQTVSGACKAAELTLKHLREIRNDEHFSILWKEMSAAQDKYNLNVPKVPRLKKVPRRLEHKLNPADPVAYETPHDLFRKVFYEVLDVVIGEVERRFKQPDTEALKAL